MGSSGFKTETIELAYIFILFLLSFSFSPGLFIYQKPALQIYAIICHATAENLYLGVNEAEAAWEAV